MATTAHSQFSASASARLLACPGSFKLGQQHDTGRRASVYSSEGTLAHAVAEACLLAEVEPQTYVGQTRTVDGFAHTVDEDFASAVEVYVAFVEGLKALGYMVALETRLSPQGQWDGLPALPIQLFGTGDCVAYNPDTHHLLIGDLKFGKGVPVEVAWNSQTLYYAAGALDMIPDTVDLDQLKVTTTIIQPRAFHRDGPIRSHQYTGREVREWARLNLYAGVQRALSDNGQTLCAGKWCRFCPALPHCQAPKDLAFETARDAFLGAPIENIPSVDDPNAKLPEHQLSDEALADLLDRIETIQPWLTAVRELALDRVENKGRVVPGWKLVPKRALRQWADDDTVIMGHMHLSGLLEDEYAETKLLTPAQVEKKIGKKRYETEVAPHVVKRSSGNTLAPEGDPRVRVRAGRTAQEAFATTPAINQGTK
jgi:hypothetical protein